MSDVILDIQGKVATIILNNPEKLNPISEAIMQGIKESLNEIKNKGISVTVLKSAGRAFSTGFDLRTPPGEGESYLFEPDILNDRDSLVELSDFLLAIRRHPTPVIAQIHGYCLAGGTDLMLSSDIAIAGEEAMIGMPNSRALGISITLLLWPLFIGPMRSKLMAFTGDIISGKQAEEWGLVAKSVPTEKLEAYVQALAERISLVDTDALRFNKLALNESMNILGYQQFIESFMSIDSIAHSTSVARNFTKLALEKGVRVALEQRDGALRGKTFNDLV